MFLFKKRKVTFEDGSSVEWSGRDSLKYTEGGSSVYIWVDFESGFFSNGKVIKSSSINTWGGEEKKKEIIDKVKGYYKSNHIPCRVE